jgi:signal transduction histidine kinase
MKGFLFSSLLIFFSLAGFAQNTETDSLKRLLPTMPEGPQRVLLLENLSYAYVSAFPDTALMYALEGLDLAKKIKDKRGEAYCTNALGNVYFGVGDYPMALEMYLTSLRMKETLKDEQGAIAVTYFNIVNVYTEQEDYAHALSYLAKTIAIDKKLKDSSGIMFDQYSLGSIYLRMNMADSAEYYTKEAYKLALKLSDMNMMGAILNNFASVNSLKKNYPEAAGYFHQSIAYCLAVKDNEVLASNYLGLARMFDSLRLADSSIYYARKCLLLAQEAPFFKQILESGEFLTRKFSTAKRYDSAFHYQSISIAAKDSLYNVEKVKKVQNLKLVEQQREQAAVAEKLKLSNRIKLYSAIAALGVFLVIAVLLWRNNIQRKKDFLLIQEQKSITEEALMELKATQAQLLLKEKMASIGELTSGIAHEIKNPLNFINNFAELNRDMLKELKEERNNPNRDRATEDEILEIFDQNMEKIAMHGQRADSIIKNMLEHSQTSRGSKEMVDINKLAEERLRIAYHALQGKLRATEPNKDHPDVQLETDFDAGLGAVNIVPEDISRVLLNLYNNALYSVNEKFHRVGTEYKPIVRVTTRRVDERVQISVWDNGEGIPDKILSKIFQPFFTTRPTGKGTGLGLSLSYDIIAKTYGGEIRVNSQEGEWAEFVIGLPV